MCVPCARVVFVWAFALACYLTSILSDVSEVSKPSGSHTADPRSTVCRPVCACMRDLVCGSRGGRGAMESADALTGRRESNS